MHALRRLAILSVLTAALLCPHPARAAQSTAVTDWNSIATSAVLIKPGRILDSRAVSLSDQRIRLGVATRVWSTIECKTRHSTRTALTVTGLANGPFWFRCWVTQIVSPTSL